MDLRKQFDKITNDYQMMHDSITNEKYSIIDIIIDLKERVEQLEDRCK